VKKFSISEDLLFAVLENTPFGIIAISSEGHIQWINSQAIVILELSTPEIDIIGESISEIVRNPYEFNSKIKEFLSTGSNRFDLEDVLMKNKYLTFRGRTTKKGKIVTIADITTIKKSELLVLNSMLEGQEKERKRLSREIHDGIGPLLSALKVNLSSVQSDVLKANENFGDNFSTAYQLIDEISDDLRSISHNLIPKILLDFGLMEALEALKDKMNFNKNMKLSLMFTGSFIRLDQVYELGIYRICQEMINNTLKHANANKSDLQLINSNHMLRIIYEDDGSGFSLSDIKKGLGLTNIENRVKALGGEWIIDSTPGKGMTATIEIPLKTYDHEEH
jgi:signal transduction histidine kinase